LFVNVPRTHQALPRCTVTDIRWRRNMVDLGRVSQLLFDGRFQRSRVCSPHTPEVSMANGEKLTPETMSENFRVFFSSAAAAAADPAWILLLKTERTNVSEQVASQLTRQRPFFHGTCVTPFGRLWSLVHRECVPRAASMSVLIKARHNRLLTCWCRESDQRQTAVSIDCDCLATDTDIMWTNNRCTETQANCDQWC